MNNQKPLVTIITVARNLIDANRKEYFKQCLNSVHNQTYQNIEHIVIDGASNDGTVDLIKKYADKGWIKYISEPDSGIYDAMNKGIKMAKGEWIYFLGSDDFLYENNIFEKVFRNSNFKKADILYGNVYLNSKENSYDGEFSKSKLMIKNICHQAMFFRKSIFDKKGLYDTKYTILADWAFNLKCFGDQDVKFKYISENVAFFRTTGLSANCENDIAFKKDKWHMVKKYFSKKDLIFFDIIKDENENINIRNIIDNNGDYNSILIEIIKQKNQEIKQKNQEIKIMKASKFWELRNKYLYVKKLYIVNNIILPGYSFLKEIWRLSKKTIRVLRDQGIGATWSELRNYIKLKKQGNGKDTKCKDFLFISGCYLEMPHRYRCEFQKEQLEKQGLSGDIKFFTNTSYDWLEYYDIFILYRVPITTEIKKFIKKAKALNKLVIFDIDDLVFDEELLKEKHEVKEMDEKEKTVYFDGVRRHKETMRLCNYGIASTETIARHMKKYIPNVLINRNSTPDSLISRSKKMWDAEKLSELKNKIILGYFSGSKTHDDDLKLIEDVLIKIFNEYPGVILLLVGPLKLSKKLEKYKNKIVRKDFVKYENLPKLIAQIDINLSPLVVNEFNNGKSELKYTEATLVKKPTIASGTEAFNYAIKDGKTGFIAKNEKEWYEKLSQLITNKKLRREIAENAYRNVIENYNTKKVGKNLINFINKYRSKKIIYVSPSTQISGGVMVVCQHLRLLQGRGYNVSMITYNGQKNLNWLDDFNIPIIPATSFRKAKLKLLDIAIATLWSTLEIVQKSTAQKKYYLVQNKEHFFYSEKNVNFQKAKETYHAKDIKFLTVSKWCQNWLKDEFNKNAHYIPNGISKKIFYKTKLLKNNNKKVRILVEGNPSDDYKNVDESFKIINKLDKNEFEVWFISYGGKPKKWYRYNKFFQRIPYKEMKNYYSRCDILLKTSRLESFSYPPLEMMACEGVCVVAENGGNKEYVKNNYNALTYKLGNINDAVSKIKKLAQNKKLRGELIANGLETVESRDWKSSIDILEKELN